jgi:hypothetical protein
MRPRRRIASVVFAGSVTFDARTEAHIRGLVVPTAARILAGAGIASAGFEIAVANLDATSAQERGARISGYSMDAAILLAMLSESLGIPIHEDIVTTGHLASPDGRLAAVGSLPAKLEAAVRDPSTHRFLYPTPDGDGSMAVLSPEQLRTLHRGAHSPQTEHRRGGRRPRRGTARRRL